MHVLIGKGNYLTPATRDDVCEIDVGVGQFFITQHIRPIASQYREKWADSIKRLLSVYIDLTSTSPSSTSKSSRKTAKKSGYLSFIGGYNS